MKNLGFFKKNTQVSVNLNENKQIMKKKVLILSSIFMFAFLMTFHVTTSETVNSFNLCGETVLAGSSDCVGSPCYLDGAQQCSGCSLGCICVRNIADEEVDP